MAHTAIQRMVAVCLAAFVVTASLLAQDYKTLVGKWNMTSESSGDPVKWTLVLKENDGKLAAALATDEGEQPAKDFTYTDGVLKFKAPYQGKFYDIELKATGEKLDGTWSGDGDSGKTSGTKA
jgi:redox-regulated HSP33 family molecular chaperone